MTLLFIFSSAYIPVFQILNPEKDLSFIKPIAKSPFSSQNSQAGKYIQNKIGSSGPAKHSFGENGDEIVQPLTANSIEKNINEDGIGTNDSKDENPVLIPFDIDQPIAKGKANERPASGSEYE